MTASNQFLDHLQFPSSLKEMTHSDLELLASEIRIRLVEISKACGGHLASNLGVVELTLALHTLFDSPTDRFVFDTSHQTYVHKMLTGRLDQMFTIRQDNGLAGFAKIAESPHDAFGAGHASTSISAALGMAHARDIKGEKYSVISVFGDASLSGGMAFEALNNVEKLKSNFICILNDNDMSISHPVGNMADYMTKIRTSDTYNSAKRKFEQIFSRIPQIGVPLTRRIEKTVERLRGLILDEKAGVLFEEFGFKYIGPLDGHNIPMLMGALKYAKAYPGPIMIHIITTKGKGLPEAEADPVNYHGVAPQKPQSSTTPPPPKPTTFTNIFGDEAIQIAKDNPDVVVITPAMKGGSGLVKYADQFPDRFFDVGIAEEHAVTFAAGLARAGIRPILAIYSTFLQRGYDQVIHDICIQKLPVTFALDRAGLVGEDGPTHHGVFDLAFLLSIPNISILAPKDGHELRAMMRWSVTQPEAVSYRYSKDAIPPEDGSIFSPIETGKIEEMIPPSTDGKDDVAIIAVGSMVWTAYRAAQLLSEYRISVTNLRFVKPLDVTGLQDIVSNARHILVVEEGCAIGGAYSYIVQQLKPGTLSNWHQIAIPDKFVEHGKLSTLRSSLSLTESGIVSLIRTITKVPVTT
ncbi:1-deoxy-D-xylulose-5-phosphate synthase [bacterium]|nr:1-deoxy-D-xylulose-5-phosphate synthase [bacterium]